MSLNAVVARTSSRTIPTGPEEGKGLLFHNGTLAASVTYTLVTVENHKALPPGSVPARVLYTGVLRFEPEESSVSERLAGADEMFTLETADGRRLACRPVEMLCASRLRWIVQLT